MRASLDRTKVYQGGPNHDQLYLSSQCLFGNVSKATIYKWGTRCMTAAGIDMKIFMPHSIRAASTSAALRAHVPMDTILNTAGWSRENIFRTYYTLAVRGKGLL